MSQLTLLRRLLVLIVALGVLLMPSIANHAFAQSTSSGTITGAISDPQGAMIPGATITVTDVETHSQRSTVTGKEGLFVVPDVPPGTYNIDVVKPGFAKGEMTSVTVSVGTQTTANFKMSIGSETTIVEVQTSNADLQTMNASTGTTVDPAMVESLPAIGRDVSTFLTMQPGVTPAGNVGGTTSDQATFQLDGGSNSSDMDGTQGVYTTSFGNSSTGGFSVGGSSTGPSGVMPMPQDSIEEFKVSTSGQTADFNNSSGSQSQIVTKRGHDQWHGTVYEYYLDSNIGANTWQNNFPGGGYTAKPSYHYSRFGAAAGGAILPNLAGGKTYLFANYEGFRYPAASTYERSVPSYEFLQLGQVNGTSAAALTAADPRHIGMSPALKAFYNSQLPVAPAGDSGSTGANGTTYAGVFDKSCGPLSGALCDSVNVIGYRAVVNTPQTSNFFVTRVDHDFGSKWHVMSSYRYYEISNLTANQVDIGGVLPGDKMGVPTAVTPRPQKPWFFVVGVTTNITSSLTNEFHYSYLRNFWQWKGAGAPPQLTGAGGAIEPLGENTLVSVSGIPAGTNVLAPFNVNAQNIRTRIWDGKDNFFRDDLTKLKGNHLIQMGGQFQHNYSFHQRTDNGASINYTPTYQLGDSGGGGNITYAGLGAVGAGTAATARLLDTYFGFVTDTQVANTYTNSGGTLSLNPANTPIGAISTIPYYNVYVTDTWHALPSLTVNYGLSYAIEMPPSERNGNQVMFTDPSGYAIHMNQWLSDRKAAALAGQVYNPTVAFALIKNVAGGRKYPYDPYFGALSPRLSFSWNPQFSNSVFHKLFGDGATVIRGGYGRIYGRINGDVQVLNPLLSPGLILATQCKYVQATSSGGSTCSQTNFTDTTAYRIGPDGVSPTLAASALPATLAQPYRPGFDGPGVAIASPVDPSVKPNNVDTFNFSIQRQINRRMMLEAGYIGRLIHNEYIMENPNSVPYMMTLGGQSFQAAYLAVEQALGCTASAGLCAKTAAPTIANQPFFEAALGGPTSAYCAKLGSCTATLLANSTMLANFRNQRVFSIWQGLDNTSGTSGTGFVFPRSLMGTATTNTTYGSAGQLVSGLSVGTSEGYSNYHGGYLSFKISSWHGMTLQENLTFAKALGLGAYNQSTSSITAEDSFNLSQQYGRQQFDQKAIFNTFIVYETPWYKNQSGIVGRLAGGWTISPVVAAGTGSPLTCTSNNSGQNFGGEDGSNFTDNESCVFVTPYRGGSHTNRGIAGSADANGINVGTSPKGPGPAAVNIFTNPAAVYDTVRPPILGLDAKDGGYGPISGLGYLNLDLSIKKKLVVWEKTSLEFSGVFFNFMNHLDFANPSLSLQSTANWGTTKTQGNSPRQIQMGLRASF